jgi:hypothetical protein
MVRGAIIPHIREITIIHDPHAEREGWRVEDHDCHGEGGMASFPGPFAEGRARRFAERLTIEYRLGWRNDLPCRVDML